MLIKETCMHFVQWARPCKEKGGIDQLNLGVGCKAWFDGLELLAKRNAYD